jgi:hypothetical protein
MGRRGTDVGVWWESRREMGHWEELDVYWRIILRWIIEG